MALISWVPDLLAYMRQHGIRRLRNAQMERVDEDFRLIGFEEIELFDTIPAPAPTERPPQDDAVDLAEMLGVEPGTEVKEAGVCIVRGCSEPSGGAMAGRLSPEMCRDHALQMGGAR